MNVVEVNTAIALAARGHRVDMLTRRDDPGLPEVLEVVPGVRLFNLAAGPADSVAKSQQEGLIEPFRAAMARWWNHRSWGREAV